MPTLKPIRDRAKVTSCLKRKGKSTKYKYVYLYQSPFGEFKWAMQYRGTFKYFNSEREAAKATDLFLIAHNKKPVNILKAK